MELLSALQALFHNRAEHIGLRLAPRWPSGGLSAASICIIPMRRDLQCSVPWLL